MNTGAKGKSESGISQETHQKSCLKKQRTNLPKLNLESTKQLLNFVPKDRAKEPVSPSVVLEELDKSVDPDSYGYKK